MNQTFKRAMSLFMALAMVMSMVPSFGTHVHAEELETEPVVVTEAPATEAPSTEAAVTEAPATEAPETEAPATEAPTEAPKVVETEASEVTTEATEPAVETEPVEETIPDATEETIPEEIFEEEIIEEEAVAVTEITADLSGLSVNGLGADWRNAGTSTNHYQGTINATGNSITITATGKNPTTTTIGLILTNKLGSEATLKFSYEMDSGTVTGASDGSFEKLLADEEQVEITFKSIRTGTSTLNITDISLISTDAADPNLTFVPGSNGSYTVDGEAITAETVKTVTAGTGLALVATPASGYQFFGWQKADGTYLSQDASYTMTAQEDVTITPVFIDASIALFGVGTAKFDDLTEAGETAAAGTIKKIVLLNNGTVSGSHTIPAGTTLLIPYDDANTAYGDKASCTSWSSAPNPGGHTAWESPTPYRTLTLAANANITVNGNIEVSGRHAAAGGGEGMYGGSPTGKLGYINMKSGSHIDLNSGANLYAWGYVYGDGTITAESGASIYENFQVMDFRGGSITSMLATDFLVFPLSQYYVQNVEVATTYKYGASEYIATSIFMSNQCLSATVKFIGDGAMFQPAAGSYFIKDYNPATDRLEMHAYGDSTMASMSLELGGTAIDSRDFVLPITNNIQIELHSGTTTLKQNMMLLPGSSLTIDKAATLNLAYTDEPLGDVDGDGAGEVVTAGGYMLQIFDSENWTTGLNMDTLEKETGLLYCHPNKQFQAVPYTATARKTRTTADLTDVTLDINGTVITNGFMYSTVTWADPANEDFTIASGGANIISSGKTGVVAMNTGAGQDMLGYLYDQTKGSYYFVPLASAQLKNGDGSYTDTTGAEAGTAYGYCATCNKWVELVDYTVTFDSNGGEGTMVDQIVEFPCCGEALNSSTFTREGYTFGAWNTAADGSGTAYSDKANIVLTENTKLYAQWNEVKKTVEVSWVAPGLENNSQEVESGTRPEFPGETPTKASDATNHYTFAGWSTTENGEALSELPAVTEDTVFYAVYKAEAHNGTDDGDCTTEVKCSCGYVTTAAKAAHEAGADDGDCTTPVKCVNCEKNAVEAKTHVDGDDKNHVCDNEGCNVDNITEHTPAADDGNCTTAITCSICGTVTTAGNTAHSFNEKASNQLAAAATCGSAATYYVQCDNCDAVSEENTVPVGEPAEKHTGSKVCGPFIDPSLLLKYHGVYCDDCYQLWDAENPYEPHKAESDGYCVCTMFGVTMDFNGGKIVEKSPDSSMSDEEWVEYVEELYGGFDATGYTTFCKFSMNLPVQSEGYFASLGEMYVKDGYELVGFAYDAEGKVPYNGELIIEPTTLYFIWQCLHEGEKTYTNLGDGFHTVTCAVCGDVITESEAHSFNDKASNQLAREATCLSAADYFVQCDNCDAVTEGKYVPVGEPAEEHSGIKVCVPLYDDRSLLFEYHGVCCRYCGQSWDPENPYEPHKVESDGACVCGMIEMTIYLNGGRISAIPPEGFTPEAWEEWVKSNFGGFEPEKFVELYEPWTEWSYDDEFWRAVFVKDGYKLVGFAYDAEGKVPYNGGVITEPTTLYFIWECLHETLSYTDSGDTHTASCPCGEKQETDQHTYTDGVCVCGKKQTFTVTVNNAYGQADNITLSNTTATYGEDYVTTVSSTVGTGIYVTGIARKSEDNNWAGNYGFEYDENTKQLTIEAEFVTDDLLVQVVPFATIKIHLNGGAVSEDWQYTYEAVESVITMPWMIGYKDYIFLTWDEETEKTVEGANEVFVRAGYLVSGYNTKADGTGTAYELNDTHTFTEDTDLYLIWQCQHEGEKTYTNLGDGFHKVTCAVCGDVIGEPVAHTYDADNHKCVCGDVETFTVSYYHNGGYMYVDYTPFSGPYTIEGKYGETITVKADRINGSEFYVYKPGNVFAGWNTKADGTGTAYAIGNTFPLTENTTLYAQYKEIGVDGVALNSGEYLDTQGNVTTTQPEGGYAYYKDGTLTLYNFVGANGDYATSKDSAQFGVEAERDLVLVLEGKNVLHGNYTWGVECYDLTIQGTGSLSVQGSATALNVETLTIESGDVTATSTDSFAVIAYESVTIKGGSLTGNGVFWVGEENGELVLGEGIVIKHPAGGCFGNYGEELFLLNADGEPATEFEIGPCQHDTLSYTNLGDGCHTVTCAVCKAVITESVAHTYDADNHKCVCGDVETFPLIVCAIQIKNGDEYPANNPLVIQVPYGAKLAEYIPEDCGEEWGNAPVYPVGAEVPVDGIMYQGVWTVDNWYNWNADDGWTTLNNDSTMPASAFEIEQDIYFTGWVNDYYDYDLGKWVEDLQGVWYQVKNECVTGWTQIDGAWYYFDPDYRDYRVEGIARVPYPMDEKGNAIAINGITYGPNSEDMGYEDFPNAESALFIFGEDGKFQNELNGMYEYEGEIRWVSLGNMAWHPGMVVDGAYYYFLGDVDTGSNIMATGDVYVSRNTTDRKFVIGGVYTFGEDGKLCEYDGITKMADGTLRYYENAQLMLGKGLVKMEDGKYIFVRSNGALVVGREYWVPSNDSGIEAGIYDFDENGFMIIPEVEPAKNGIYFEDGQWFYYVNGAKGYGAGLISGTFEWNDEDAAFEATAIIYVRSNGALATGKYWITNVELEGYEKGFYNFDDKGMLSGRQNGIIDGVYYVNGEVQYNAGLIEYNGGYIYVRSSGKVATGTYWITNTNGVLPAGCYEFDENGYMIVENLKNGIVQEGNSLCYYVNGIKQIGTGLVELSDGSYIYVKTNGELATGAYWVTNVGTTGMEQGLYQFNTDGILVK